jgi:hypothetical protein
MRGGRNPLSVDAISSLAEAAGVVVPIPTFQVMVNNNHPKDITFLSSKF